MNSLFSQKANNFYSKKNKVKFFQKPKKEKIAISMMKSELPQLTRIVEVSKRSQNEGAIINDLMQKKYSKTYLLKPLTSSQETLPPLPPIPQYKLMGYH
jgi:hypothetical protein